jgi:hypothetical protein
MYLITTLTLITGIAVFTSVIIGRVFFDPSSAHAYSLCKTINHQIGYNILSDQVICGTNIQIMPISS